MNSAGNKLEQRFTVGPHAELWVTYHTGTITVTRGEDAVIRVGYDDYDDERDAAPVIAAQDGDTVRVSPNATSRVRDTDLRIAVPQACAVQVTTRSGDIGVHDTGGPVQAESISGDVDVQHVAGRCAIRTVAGDVSFRRVDGETQVNTVGGDISGDDVRGPLRASSTSGDIQIARSDLTRCSAGNVNGDISIETRLVPGETYEMTSVNGTITLIAPKDSGATVRMHTEKGDMHCRLPAEVVAADKRHWEGTLNGGGATVALKSVGGDLFVECADAAGARSSSVPQSPVTPEPAVSPTPAMEPFSASDPVASTEAGSPAVSEAPPAAEDRPSQSDETIEILARLQRGELTVEEAMAGLDQVE